MKYVVDTSIFNKLLDGVIDRSELPVDGQLVISHIQIDELNNTNDKERRARLLVVAFTIVTEVIPTESFVIGTSRLDQGKLSDGTLFRTLKDELDALNKCKPNNVMDALIGEIAVRNGYTLLTTDSDLRQVAEAHGGTVIYWPPV